MVGHPLSPRPKSHSQLVSHHTYQMPSENRAHGKVKDVVLELEGGKLRGPGRTGRGRRPSCLSSTLAGVVHFKCLSRSLVQLPSPGNGVGWEYNCFLGWDTSPPAAPKMWDDQALARPDLPVLHVREQGLSPWACGQVFSLLSGASWTSQGRGILTIPSALETLPSGMIYVAEVRPNLQNLGSARL